MKTKTITVRKKWDAFWGLLIFSLFMAYASAHAEEVTDVNCASVNDSVETTDSAESASSPKQDKSSDKAE